MDGHDRLFGMIGADRAGRAGQVNPLVTACWRRPPLSTRQGFSGKSWRQIFPDCEARLRPRPRRCHACRGSRSGERRRRCRPGRQIPRSCQWISSSREIIRCPRRRKIGTGTRRLYGLQRGGIRGSAKKGAIPLPAQNPAIARRCELRHGCRLVKKYCCPGGRAKLKATAAMTAAPCSNGSPAPHGRCRRGRNCPGCRG